MCFYCFFNNYIYIFLFTVSVIYLYIGSGMLNLDSQVDDEGSTKSMDCMYRISKMFKSTLKLWSLLEFSISTALLRYIIVTMNGHVQHKLHLLQTYEDINQKKSTILYGRNICKIIWSWAISSSEQFHLSLKCEHFHRHHT